MSVLRGNSSAFWQSRGMNAAPSRNRVGPAGELLNRAELNFDVVITIDQGLRYQQNLAGRQIAVIIIRAKSNRLVDLEPLFPACAKALLTISFGQVIEIPKRNV